MRNELSARIAAFIRGQLREGAEMSRLQPLKELGRIWAGGGGPLPPGHATGKTSQVAFTRPPSDPAHPQTPFTTE